MLTNSNIAELLAREAENASHFLQRALRKASRAAFLWPEEAARLVEQGRSLTEFPAIGPYLEKVIRGWLGNPPRRPRPPKIRAHFLTMAEARRVLSAAPSWAAALRGDLQMHTRWSDGSGSVSEMAQMGLERGYDYIAITDHSKGLKIAGGMNERQLREQEEDIACTNEGLSAANHSLRILRSVEMNLNPRGEGDMELESLKRLDLVLGSFHSALRKTEDQTPRYIAALRNPHIQILGHPRGRIYNFRLGLTADWPAVFSKAAELDKAVEIDAYPDRQDLSSDLLEMARAAGVRVSLGTDAHHPEQLAFMELGLAAALRADIPKDRILNFMPRDELLEWVAQTRECAIDE